MDKNAIPIGCALGSANQHDSKLFTETLLSIPTFIQMPYYKEMHLDAAFDCEDVEVALFNNYYVPRIARNKRANKRPIQRRKLNR